MVCDSSACRSGWSTTTAGTSSPVQGDNVSMVEDEQLPAGRIGGLPQKLLAKIWQRASAANLVSRRRYLVANGADTDFSPWRRGR